MVFALHHLIRGVYHIIAEIIKAEFIISTVGDVCIICIAAGIAVRLVLIYTIHAQSQPFENGAVPFTIPFCEVIIHGYNMYPFPGQCIQVGGQCTHQRFTFTRCHFCDLAGMQYCTADQLHIVMHHIPGYGAARGRPGILKDRLVTFYRNVIFFGCQFTIQVRSSCGKTFIFFKTTACFFYHGKCFRLYL